MGRSSLTSLQKEQQAIRKKLSSKSAKHTEQKQYKTILKDVLIDKSSKAKKKASILLQNSQITHENKENTSENPILYENNYIQAPFHKEDPSYKRGLYETEEKSRKTKLSKKEKARNKEIELQAEQEEKLYPEHEEKVNRKFIKSIKEKKEYTNRLAPKVTEVYPISKAPEKEENQRKIQEKDHEVIIDQM